MQNTDLHLRYLTCSTSRRRSSTATTTGRRWRPSRSSTHRGRASASSGPVGRVGTALVADRRGRARHQVDVVALDPTAPGTRVAVLGEAKAGTAGEAEVARLRHVRDLLVEAALADAGTRLVVCGAEGVDRRLEATDVVTVDASDLVGL